MMQHVASGDNARCNKSGGTQRLKQARAAEALGINRSSLKRYLDRYPELMGEDGKVDLDRVRQHRADNPDVVDAARKVEEHKVARPKADGRRMETKSRLDEAKAQQAELDLAERLGQVVDPGEMLDAVAEAGNFLRERLINVDFVLAERLASEIDPRQIRALLQQERRDLATELKKKFDAIVQAASKGNAHEPS